MCGLVKYYCFLLPKHRHWNKNFQFYTDHQTTKKFEKIHRNGSQTAYGPVVYRFENKNDLNKNRNDCILARLYSVWSDLVCLCMTIWDDFPFEEWWRRTSDETGQRFQETYYRSAKRVHQFFFFFLLHCFVICSVLLCSVFIHIIYFYSLVFNNNLSRHFLIAIIYLLQRYLFLL